MSFELCSCLESIGEYCFYGCGLDEIVIPKSVKCIQSRAFESCKYLKRVTFAGDGLEVIEQYAFTKSGLESFTAPSSLKKIGDIAFGKCSSLREVKLNEGIQELGQLCFWGTQITDTKILSRAEQTPQQLEIGQTDLKVLRFQDGIETVKQDMLTDSSVEKVIVPISVTVLGSCAFSACEQLREIVFEPGSRLKTIESNCFMQSGLRRIVIPRSVQTIGDSAFSNCVELQEVTFEPGSCLKSIG